MSRDCRAIVVAILGTLLLCSSAAASPIGHPGVRVLHPQWVNLRHEEFVSTVGHYTVLRRADQTTIGPLIDQRTGQRIRVPVPLGCEAGPSLLDEPPGSTAIGVFCNNAPAAPTVETYPVPDGPWTAVPASISTSIGPECAAYDADMGTCNPVAVSRYWISYAMTCYHCGGVEFAVLNLVTGAFGDAADQPGPGEISNLSSPTLESPLCTSLASSVDGNEIADDGFVLHQHRNGWTLRRCGSAHLTQLATDNEPPAVEPHVILWTTPTAIDGITLPSQRRFVLVAPKAARTLVGVTLTPDRIYLTATLQASLFAASPRFRTWATALPSARPTRGHQHAREAASF